MAGEQRARRGGPIHRSALVALGLKLADREGLEAVTFRRLADRLEVTPMALYHHVRHKADLLAAMIDLVLSEVELPVAGRATGWADELREILRSFVAVKRRHPCAAELLKHPPALTPHVLRVAERMLDLLRRAGFGPAEAIRVVQQLGVLLNVGVGVAPAPGAREGGDAQRWAALARYPRMREAAQHLGSWRKVEDMGIEILVRGVEGVLGKPKRESSKKR